MHSLDVRKYIHSCTSSAPIWLVVVIAAKLYFDSRQSREGRVVDDVQHLLIFNKPHKCGGTSIAQALEKSFGREEYFYWPARLNPADKVVETLFKHGAMKSVKAIFHHSVLSSRDKASLAQFARKSLVTMTAIRDPDDRLFSFFLETSDIRAPANTTSTRELFKVFLSTYRRTFTIEYMSGKFVPDDVEDIRYYMWEAVEIAKSYDIIFNIDYVEQSMAVYKYLMGTDLPTPGKINVRSTSRWKSDIVEGFESEFAKAVQLDRLMYDVLEQKRLVLHAVATRKNCQFSDLSCISDLVVGGNSSVMPFHL
jgi:Sulfotransferase family